MVRCPFCAEKMKPTDKDTYAASLGEYAKYLPFGCISYMCEQCKAMIIVLYTSDR